MKKLLSVLLVAAMALMLCVPAMAEGDYSIAVIMKASADASAYWATVAGGCENAGTMMNVNVTVTGPAAETEVDEQVAMITEAIANGANALVIAPLDDAAVNAALEGYEGVVIYMDTKGTYEKAAATVMTDNTSAAMSGAVYGLSAHEIDSTVAMIVYGQEGDSTSAARKDGYEQVLYMNGLEPVAEVSGNNTTADTEAAVTAALVEHPEVNLILCHNDDTAIGALNAVKAAGLTDVTIMGFDGTADALALVESGELYGTVSQEANYIGYLAVQSAALACDGEHVPANLYINTDVIGNY